MNLRVLSVAIFTLVVLYCLIGSLKPKRPTLALSHSYDLPNISTALTIWIDAFNARNEHVDFQIIPLSSWSTHTQGKSISVPTTFAKTLAFFQAGVEAQVWATLQAYMDYYSPRVSQKLAFDVGANAGFFTLVMAANGFIVQSFEPNPHCMQQLAVSVHANGLDGMVIPHRVGVSHERYTFSVGSACDPDFSIDPKAMGQVSTESLATYFQNPSVFASVIKIDTEGSEIPVLTSLHKAIEQRQIGALVVEVVPKLWDKFGFTLDQGAAVFAHLQRSGYKMYVMYDDAGYGSTVLPSRAPLGILEPRHQWWGQIPPTTLGLFDFLNDLLVGGHGSNVLFALHTD